MVFMCEKNRLTFLISDVDLDMSVSQLSEIKYAKKNTSRLEKCIPFSAHEHILQVTP